MQTLTLTHEEDTAHQKALVIPHTIAHVLARAMAETDGDIAAFRDMLIALTHRTDELRETRIRAARQVLALEIVTEQIARYLATR